MALKRKISRTTIEESQEAQRNLKTRKKNPSLDCSDRIENIVLQHSCGAMNLQCKFCKAFHFSDELSTDNLFSDCCSKGKVKLLNENDIDGNPRIYPRDLRDLLTNRSNPYHDNYKKNIRGYNNAFSFASFGGKFEEITKGGPYIFKANGKFNHRTSHIAPVPGTSPKFAQLYAIELKDANEARINFNPNLKVQVLNILDSVISKNNKYAQSFRMMSNIMNEQREKAVKENKICPQIRMVLKKDRTDSEAVNCFKSNEIALFFINDNSTIHNQDIEIYSKNHNDEYQQLISMNILSSNLQPMTYPLLFPFGESGWQPNLQLDSYIDISTRKRRNVTMLEYYSALIATRDTFNPITMSGNLFQQWIVDSYFKIVLNNLNFIRYNQKKLRVETYKCLNDYVQENTENSPGRRVILPSTFPGSIRNMKERCNDAMSIFNHFGPPDVFITFTANTNWPEIIQNLVYDQNPFDRPDLIARVFRIKLKELIRDVVDQGIFGEVLAYTYSIEFTKRGIPHAHILVTLAEDNKLSTAEKVEEIVSAELPDKDENPRLFEIVTKFMLHNPCGINFPLAHCMVNAKCSKKYPKKFSQSTEVTSKGIITYKRRDNNSVIIKGHCYDNRHVVPFNKFLLLKFNAHINVEVWSGIQGVKYIHKNICEKNNSTASIQTTGTDSSDEITQFLSCCNVGAIEAAYRIFKFPTYQHSHSVIRLAVHLENEQFVTFREGNEEEAIENSSIKGSTLTKYFELNRNDEDARQFYYTEIPYHYVFTNGLWKKRQRGGDKLVVRMYHVSISETERYCLRLLLLTVKGATCYDDLRTVDGTVHPTNISAASALGLIECDSNLRNCIKEIAAFREPARVRQIFALILLYRFSSNPLALWEEFKCCMTSDDKGEYNLALVDIEKILLSRGKSCVDFKLPSPTKNSKTLEQFVDSTLLDDGKCHIETLNLEQRSAFEKIVFAVENPNVGNCFFVDGPGGSGKTYLYNILFSFLNGQGRIVLSYATTGIAATLLKGGRTVHSGFKLPLHLDETSTSYMKANSDGAELLRKSSLIIIDEISMMQKDALRCIDILLRDVMGRNLPFGGKVMLFGGDFRQTLPIINNGSRSTIIESSIKSSSLWHHFQQLSLKENMRTNKQESFNNWILKIGNGETPHLKSLPENSIEIPERFITCDSIIDDIFGQQISESNFIEMTRRVILTTRNEECVQINNEIIASISGEQASYLSIDSIVLEDQNDIASYTQEFLQSLNIPGLPPSKLVLKIGTVVMLLRNLCPERGLCNGTRMIIKQLNTWSITAEILSEKNKGSIVDILKIDLVSEDSSYPFKLKRHQLPIIPAFAITINKAQGQTYDFVGIYLNTPVFAHGQLYVALSRCSDPKNIKIKIDSNSLQKAILTTNEIYTQNIVYSEIFAN